MEHVVKGGEATKYRFYKEDGKTGTVNTLAQRLAW